MKEKLLQMATEAYKNAYAPYSNFKVGAALLCKNGNIYTGCNVENAAGTSICAERTAICKAISEGETEFAEIAAVCEQTEKGVPCGFCLQTLAEFCGDDFLIHTPIKSYTLAQLLPIRFKM